MHSSTSNSPDNCLATMVENAKKRKQTAAAPADPKRPRFGPRPQHVIATAQTASAYPNGELNVSQFMRAHENEIRSLEKAMKLARKGLARRAFQDVPRDLRRRTASHNPQRVPKRLRSRAKKEAKEDNTPISKSKSGSGIGKGSKQWLRKERIEQKKKERERRKKRKDANKITVTNVVDGGKEETAQKKSDPATQSKSNVPKASRKQLAKLAVPANPPSKFRRRQANKTWLPTHIWHAKRALMTPPKEPLWRFAIPLAPVVKAYRLTYRAASQTGAVAWDMSYMSTISLEGAESSITGLLKGLRFAEEDDSKQWQERGLGKKWRNGTRIWEGWIHEREGGAPRKIAQVTVIWSVQTSSDNKKKVFIRVHPSAFLQLWNEVTRIAKVQKPAVAVEDLRFEIGSIEIMGPAAAETLCSVLSPSPIVDMSADAPQSIWPTLASVRDVGELPPDPLLAFSCSDPRLRDPLETSPIPEDIASDPKFFRMLAEWPVDNTQTAPALFSRNARLAAGRSLPSQKSINRRKSTAVPGKYADARETDPQIPLIVHASRRTNSWTLLLPWKCVTPVWRCMMRYPVSTSGNPRFGGLNERRQVDFERSKPSFPFDHPGTDAGWTWELQEREERKREWTKRPKGKRIEWTTIKLGGRKGELGDPWACDWERLIPKPSRDEKDSDLTRSPLRQSTPKDALAFLGGHLPTTDPLSRLKVFTVKLSMVQRGVPTNCARIYRLPTKNVDLRNKWLSLMPGSTSGRKRHIVKQVNPNPNTKKALALRLLESGAHDSQHGGVDEPVVPDEEDIIGFVTSGNYNLAEGRTTAIANLVLHRVIDDKTEKAKLNGVEKEWHVCIIREAGQTFGRLATWEVV